MSNALTELDAKLLLERAAVVPGCGTGTVAYPRLAPASTIAPAFPRNAAPSRWYEFLRRADRCVPASIFDGLLRIGAWVAVFIMPCGRRYSREYLAAVFGRPARLTEIWRHFFAFTEMLVLRLRMAEGRPHHCRPLPSCDEFKAVLTSRRPALLGTFHFGNSDLLGFLLSTFGCHVHMIRLRMKTSRDTHRLGHRFGKSVTFIWVNDTSNLLFAVKQAAQSGSSIALKCDRPEHSSKLEAFEFLGERRLFPFTIYHLAIMFQLPVGFCVGVPGGADESLLHGSPVFEPNAASKAENLERGRAHFQEALTHLETLVRANPFLWFNFTPLIPVAAAVPTRSPELVAAETGLCQGAGMNAKP
jgi:predicted LPLAT superfamily acyltransferase